MFVLGWLLPLRCCLSVVSCQSLSVVGCRSPTAVRWLFFLLHRSLPVDICRIFLALPSRQPHGPSSFGVRAINVCTYKCTHRTCVCPAHLLFPREILHMQPRNSVQLCNCATVQLFNCPTVQLVELFPAWKARATTSVAVETSSTPHLLQWHHLHFPQHLHPRHAIFAADTE